MTIDEFTRKIPGRLSVTYKQPEGPAATLSGAMASTLDNRLAETKKPWWDNRLAETKKPWCAGLEGDHWMDCGYGDTQEEALDSLAAKMLAKKRADVASKRKWLAEAEAELAALGVALGVAQAVAPDRPAPRSTVKAAIDLVVDAIAKELNDCKHRNLPEVLGAGRPMTPGERRRLSDARKKVGTRLSDAEVRAARVASGKRNGVARMAKLSKAGRAALAKLGGRGIKKAYAKLPPTAYREKVAALEERMSSGKKAWWDGLSEVEQREHFARREALRHAAIMRLTPRQRKLRWGTGGGKGWWASKSREEQDVYLSKNLSTRAARASG